MIGLPVLVLNQSYQPLNVCTVRRAVVLLTGSKAELLEKGYGEVQSPSMETPIPSVIRLMYLVRKPFLRKRLSRKGIFLRDKYRCLYCSRGATQLTIDHVVPRYRGGSHSWGNVVAACKSCKQYKAGRTPQEAGMNLPNGLGPPRTNPYSILFDRPLEDAWRKFLPWPDL